ncbi:hypothetical protein LEP1GSC036_2271 [Leptospira weilii str. 2006001853]|uniref:Uncharacterized protein n=1 Tax=Leptospira weilii str. 2006001853 TaxID=1001589 RepID=A0A828YYU3_9LEPT|nr:hypothetical protein LEP1GSC036_2271 [Leptospira weilii str. 2006001853]
MKIIRLEQVPNKARLKCDKTTIKAGLRSFTLLFFSFRLKTGQ